MKMAGILWTGTDKTHTHLHAFSTIQEQGRSNLCEKKRPQGWLGFGLKNSPNMAHICISDATIRKLSEMLDIKFWLLLPELWTPWLLSQWPAGVSKCENRIKIKKLKHSDSKHVYFTMVTVLRLTCYIFIDIACLILFIAKNIVWCTVNTVA